MKKCPFCAESIKDAAVVCRYCNRDLPTAAQSRHVPVVTDHRTTYVAAGALIVIVILALVWIGAWLLRR